ncbi:hypothetical protein [Streptomyces sp. NPDC060054]|uniref:hypothetical protein n=1 Tax=unclassified Streptomyces TaxID=2593676 RepID=UPI00093CA87F|nr:hypothetical protein A6A29_13725 [Streptomyces sp. TSRI0281]
MLAGLLLTSACAAPDAPATGPTAREVGAVLDRRADAVLDHDPDAYLAALAPGATKLRATQRTELANLADIPLKSWTYEVKAVTEHGADKVTADVELRYRIAGYDTAPIATRRTLELTRSGAGDRWYITADRPGKGAADQLWQQGDVQVVRGRHSLVLGVGRDPGELRRVADTEDLAVPAVSAAWPQPWAGRVVVLVPDSVEDMAKLLGSPEASYRGIAAVTTGEVGGSGRSPALADRVIINPQAYAMLGTFGQRVVLTHETTHVATRPRTSTATPMWLSEGFADWTAYREEGRPAPEIAPELAEAVRRGELPAALPVDDDFAFGGDPGKLARAYEGGWLACALIADRWGEEKLIAFYEAVGDHPGRDGAVEQAMGEVLDTTPQDFTAYWRDYLSARLG